MGLLQKALAYRNKFYYENKSSSGSGLLNRAQSYLKEKLHNFNINDLNEDNKKIQLTGSYNKDQSSYFETLNNISIKLSSLSLKENAGFKLNEIITKEFNISKNIFLIYSIENSKFIVWNSTNFDSLTKQNFTFDLEYNKFYLDIVKNKHVLLDLKNKNDLNRIKEILSENDLNESDFIFMIPFVFSGYIIGIYCAMQLQNRQIPDNDLIDALMMTGRLNGSLLYNIYQREKFFKDNHDAQNAENSLNADFREKENNDQVTLGSDLNVNRDRLEKNIFQIIAKNEINNYSLISMRFLNALERQEFQLLDFYSDIQFIVMNLVGADAYIEILEDLSIYIILPSINKINADKMAINIIKEIKRIFLEITSDYVPDIDYKVIEYPNDIKDSSEILKKI